jgi:phosphoribosylformimino-5-aminoimidazole carboxamide ribonucleotide (ProFAR) isomerase
VCLLSFLDGILYLRCDALPDLVIMKVVPLYRLRGRSLTRRAYARGELSSFGSKLADKFEKLYVADDDGIGKNKPQLDVVQELCDEIPTLYEGGVRVAGNVIDMLITGAEKAVVGTATLMSLDELRGAFKLSENITLKVDYRDGIVSFDPSIAGRAFLHLSRDLRSIGVSDIVVPASLAEEAVAAKTELGFTLGIFAPVSERSRMEALGVDYIISDDYGRLNSDE